MHQLQSLLNHAIYVPPLSPTACTVLGTSKEQDRSGDETGNRQIILHTLRMKKTEGS